MLQAWRRQCGLSRAGFGHLIGVSAEAVRRYESGERRPEWPVMLRILRATGGAVTPNDFVGQAPERQAA